MQTSGIFKRFVEVVESSISQRYELEYSFEQFSGWFEQSAVRLGVAQELVAVWCEVDDEEPPAVGDETGRLGGVRGDVALLDTDGRWVASTR